jgi:hypothetical protein
VCECATWLDSKRHTWREDVTDAWWMATQAWLLHRENVAIGYATEMAEFEEHHPRPRLADFMSALSAGTPPEQLGELFQFDVCPSCRGTGHQHPERQAS